MPIIHDDVAIDPWDLLEVQYRVGRLTRRKVAFEVRYVVVELSGSRSAVAVQILYDLYDQSPGPRAALGPARGLAQSRFAQENHGPKARAGGGAKKKPAAKKPAARKR